MLSPMFELSQHFLSYYQRPYRRYFLSRHLLNHRFTIITGQRGVGKTTVMIQHLLDLADGDLLSDKILYVQADHIAVRQHRLYDIGEIFCNRGGQIVCFDEIHKYTDWSAELKSLYDTFPDLTILASGSSALEISRGSHDLSRRAVVHSMVGLSFREYIELRTGLELAPFALEEILSDHPRLSRSVTEYLAPSDQKVLGLFQEYLRHGVYPFFLEFPDEETFHQILEQNIRATIEADIPAANPRLSGETVRKLKGLLAYLAGAVPLMPDLSRLQRILELGDPRTLKTYLKYLEDAGIIRQLARSGKSMGALEKPGKIYLGDTCQFNAVTIEPPHVGNLRETFFAAALAPEWPVTIPSKGDFQVGGRWLFEVGGKQKSLQQIRGETEAYLALDDLEHGHGLRIPLWLFGMLY